MKKILIISCVFPPEPVVSAQLSLDIAEALSKNNDVTVISPRPTRPMDFKFDEKQSNYPFTHIVESIRFCLYGKFDLELFFILGFLFVISLIMAFVGFKSKNVSHS